MTKQFFKLIAVLAVCSFVFLECKKKADDTIHPTYKEEAPGSMGNPNPNYNPPTGTNTTVPPTQNSVINVGAAGWSNLSCVSTNSLYLKSSNGDNHVTLQFALPPSIGTFTYNIATNPGFLTCAMIVTGDPNQPKDITWYGYDGLVSVTTTTNAVNALIIGSVKCRQSNFSFPIVSVTGVLGCN